MPKGRRKRFQGRIGLGVLALILAVAIGSCDSVPESDRSATRAGSSVQRVVVVTATPRIVLTATPAPTAILTRTARPTATPAPTPTKTTIYTVQTGDNLSAIADRFGVELDALIAANGIDDPNLITVGAVLEIPRRGVSVQATRASQVTPTVQGTRTVRPPRTPRATTSAPCDSASERQYFSTMTGKLGPIDAALRGLAHLLNTGARDPQYYMSDINWRAGMALNLASLQAYSNEILKIRPPRSFQSLHRHAMDTARNWISWTKLVAEGLGAYDVRKTGEAGPFLTRGNDSWRKYTAAFDRICR